MALTLGNWLCLLTLFIVVGALVFFLIYEATDEYKKSLIGLGIIFMIFFFVALGISWYNKNTASGIRRYKDFQSELTNGIYREITITAEDGREIFKYEGKVDIESNHEDNYIKFESEDGRRYIIYYGIQDTITIIEKKPE